MSAVWAAQVGFQVRNWVQKTTNLVGLVQGKGSWGDLSWLLYPVRQVYLVGLVYSVDLVDSKYYTEEHQHRLRFPRQLSPNRNSTRYQTGGGLDVEKR